MDLQSFKDICDGYRLYFKQNDTLHKAGVDVATYAETYNEMLDLMWKSMLTVEGYDWIQWYLFETLAGTIEWEAKVSAVDSKGKPICFDDESTYDFFIKQKYFK